MILLMVGKKVLIGCFDGERNPSRILLNELQASMEEQQDINYLLLSSVYSKLEQQLEKAIGEIKPDYIFLFGVALERNCINIERFALNFDDSGKKDSNGSIRKNCLIVEDGKTAYMSQFQIEELLNLIKRNGLTGRISNNAGCYLCNHAFYYSFYLSEKLGIRSKTCFIHLPQVMELGGKNKKITISALSNVFYKYIDHLCK